LIRRSAAKTVADLCARLSIVEAVVLVDAARHCRRTQLDEL